MRDSKQGKPELLERALAAGCYLSCGFIGLIYILFSGRHSNSPFFRFHFLQSIIIGIFTYLLGWAETIIKDTLIGISGLIFSVLAPAADILALINNGIGLLWFLITKLAFLLLVYGFVLALLGKYAEIPGLSRLVYKQLRY